MSEYGWWERPPEYDDPPEPPAEDCLNCGRCEGCIQQSIAFAEEMNDAQHENDCPYCEGDGCHECDGTGEYE